MKFKEVTKQDLTRCGLAPKCLLLTTALHSSNLAAKLFSGDTDVDSLRSLDASYLSLQDSDAGF